MWSVSCSPIWRRWRNDRKPLCVHPGQVAAKINSVGTDSVWLYDMKADGWSLDNKRQPLLTEDKIGLQPLRDGHSLLSKAEQTKNDLPDVLARWGQRHESAGSHTEPRGPATKQLLFA